jgi:hypothetical protein
MNERQGRTGGIVAGLILVVLGLLFLFRDWIDVDWGVIWPFFLIVPGAWVLGRAIFARDQRDRTGGFIGGGILLFLGVVFLLQNYYDLDWQKIWPFFLIIPGAGLLIGAFLGWGRRGRSSAPDAWNQPGPGPTPPPPGIQPPAGG